MPKDISSTFYERWKSANHVGGAKPSLRVTVTRGLIDKTYQPFEFLGGGSEDFAMIVGGNNREPWQGFWRATGEPKEVPNVYAAKWQQGFAQQGSRSATVEVENIIYKAIVGVGGTYHAIMRGYLSPWLGMQLIARAHIPNWVENEWFEVLDNGYKLDIFEGYGDEMVRTFSGLIEDADLETQPDRITITARDFGILFTDQRMMGWNKPPECRAPVQIADRRTTLGVKPVGSGPLASSAAGGRPVSSIVKPGNRSDWVSAGHTSAAGVEWVEMSIPAGFYEDFYTVLPYKGQAIYVSVFAKPGSIWNGEAVEGWIDGGKGNVPEDEGEHPFTNAWGGTSTSGATRSLGGDLQAAAGTIVRLSLRALPYRSEWGDHRAGVTRFALFRFGSDSKHPAAGSPETHAKGWVLIDDLSDIAKEIFLWAGFHEWEVEDLGVSLHNPMAWAMDKFLADVLTDIQAQANWLAYVESPSADEESIGVPCFVHNRANDPPQLGMLEVRDSDLLESMKTKIDLSNLPYVIRLRGNVDEKNGITFDGDLVKRYNGTYFPPWSGAGPIETESGRTAGVRRHALVIDPNLNSDEECIFSAILTGIQYALEAYTGECQISGYPLELNQQISVVDKTSGVNSRLWTSSIQSEHTTGPAGEWKMTVGGALIDNIDMQQLNLDLETWREIAHGLANAKDELIGNLTF